jgi:hypothetical protein
MRIEVVTTGAELEELGREWDALVDAAASDGIFVSHAWIAAWWRAYGRDALLHLVCVRDDEGTLVGLAPLYLANVRPGEPATLRFIGTGGDTSPDYVGVIARHGREREVAASVVDHLHAPAAPLWDVALFTDLCEEARMTDALEAELRRHSGAWRTVRRADAVCPYTTLPRTREQLFANLPPRLQRVLRSREKLEKAHAIKLIVWGEQGEDVADGMDHLARLPRERHAFEVRETQTTFARELGAPARYFAYPNGLPADVDGRTVTEVRRHGFSHAFTTVSGVASATDHRLLLPRIAPEDEPGVMLGLELARVVVRDALRAALSAARGRRRTDLSPRWL